MSVAFDTLTYANELKNVGVPVKQAETMSKLQAEIIDNNLATKSDVKELAAIIARLSDSIDKRFDFIEKNFATKSDIVSLEDKISSLQRDIRESEQRLIIRLGGMMVIGFGVVAALVKIL